MSNLKNNKKAQTNIKNNKVYSQNSIDRLSDSMRNIFPESYIDTIGEVIMQRNYFAHMLDNIFPKNYINTITEIALSQNNLTKIVENILPKNYIEIINEYAMNNTNNIVRNIVSQNYIVNILEYINTEIKNTYYSDAITGGLKEIFDSNITLNSMLKNSNLNCDNIEEIDEFNEEDKKETLTNVKEIIEISKKDNAEQLIYNKLIKIKESHPIVATVLFQIFWIIISMLMTSIFTQNSNNYYIQNYTVNNIVVEEKQDFIDNARYVNAEKLNMRKGPSKDYDIIDTLKYGDVVKVKTKAKYWTKIIYKDIKKNISIEGWVYTRYLSNFDIELLNN